MHKNPDFSQRDLADKLGFSLGKLNYCLRALKNKGLVKIKNFRKSSNKISHIQYILTAKGISVRTKLTLNFMKRKIKEYDELKKELKKVMWVIFNINLKKVNFFEQELLKKLGSEYKIYYPKIKIKVFKNKKLTTKIIPLLGNYVFCFHQEFKSKFLCKALSTLRV